MVLAIYGMCVEGMIIEASYSDGFTRWERKWSYQKEVRGHIRSEGTGRHVSLSCHPRD
jgi:hypothetical protein